LIYFDFISRKCFVDLIRVLVNPQKGHFKGYKGVI